jgi:hypothetical protein
MSEGPLRVRRHDQASAPYQALLREYLRARLRLDPERQEDRRLAEGIIRAADGRFAYVSFLADRLEQLPAGDLAGLGAGERLYRRWLAGLDLEYGRKQADAMRQVLALLAAAKKGAGLGVRRRAQDRSGNRRRADAAVGTVRGAGGRAVGALVGPRPAGAGRILRPHRPGAAGDVAVPAGGAMGMARRGRASLFRLALKEFLPAANGDPKLSPLLPLMQARIATRALDAIELIRSGEDADGAAWGFLAPMAPLVEAAVHLCGSDPVMRRWRPEELSSLLNVHKDALMEQGLALERV